MTDPKTPEKSSAPGTGNARSVLALTLFAALFGGGLLLAWSLNAGKLVAAGAAQVKADAEEAPSLQAADAAGADALIAMEQRLGDANERIDTLATRTESGAALAARIEQVEEQLAQAGESGALAARVAELEDRLAQAEAAAAGARSRGAADAEDEQAALKAAYTELGAQFSPRGMLVRLDEAMLRFAPGRAELPADAAQALAPLARFLRDHPEQIALLRGHTDSVGNADANLELAAERAESVRELLVELGVPAAQLQVEGVGDAEPIADNSSADGRQRNRRVDILLRDTAEA
jgi:chemotaxis protein MotB